MQAMRRLCFSCALAVLMLAGLAPQARAEALSMVSKTDEMVMGINVRQIVDSALFQQFLKVRKRAKYQLDILKERTGIDFLTDVDKVFIYGKAGARNSMGMVFKGRINQQQVLAKLALNPENTTLTLYGLTVHAWMDSNDKMMKYGAFLPDGTTILWSSKEVMEGSINAVRDKTIQLLASPEGKMIPEEDDKSTLWMIAFNREGKMRTPQNFQFTQMTAFLTMNTQEVQARVAVVPKNEEDVQNWVQMIQGAIMMFQFQDNNPLLTELVQRTRVKAGADEKSVELTTALGLKNVLDMITGRQNLDDSGDN